MSENKTLLQRVGVSLEDGQAKNVTGSAKATTQMLANTEMLGSLAGINFTPARQDMRRGVTGNKV